MSSRMPQLRTAHKGCLSPLAETLGIIRSNFQRLAPNPISSRPYFTTAECIDRLLAWRPGGPLLSYEQRTAALHRFVRPSTSRWPARFILPVPDYAVLNHFIPASHCTSIAASVAQQLYRNGTATGSAQQYHLAHPSRGLYH